MTTQEPEIEQVGEQAAAVPEAAAERERGSVRSALFGSALYLAFFAFMTWFNTAEVKLSPVVWAAIAPLTTVAYLLILVYTIRLICRLSLTARVETLAMVVALFVFVAINPDAHEIITGVVTGKPLTDIFASLGGQKPAALDVLVPFFLIVTGVYFGQLLSRIIREASLLVPVTLVSGLIDFWGVYWGPVGQWSEQAPTAVNVATAATAAASVPEHVYTAMPQQLQIFGSIAPPDSIGIGDFVFIAFFLTCAYRLGFSARRTMWGIFLGLLAASLVMALDGSTLFGIDVNIAYLPGLIFICGGAFLANLTSWRLSKQEWAMTGVIAAILIGMISVSIVRAEADKPRIRPTSYQTTAKSNAALVHESLQRVIGKQADAGELIIYSGWFGFVNKDAPDMKAFEIRALIRPANVQLKGTYDVFITGQASRENPGSWHIEGYTQTPPNDAVELLRKEPKEAPLQVIDKASGIPLTMLALLDEIENTGEWKDQTLILEVAPDKFTLWGDPVKGKKERREVQTYDPSKFPER